jgi:hypothetical protein
VRAGLIEQAIDAARQRAQLTRSGATDLRGRLQARLAAG